MKVTLKRHDRHIYKKKVSRWKLFKWLIKGSFKLEWWHPYDKKNKGFYIKPTQRNN